MGIGTPCTNNNRRQPYLRSVCHPPERCLALCDDTRLAGAAQDCRRLPSVAHDPQVPAKLLMPCALSLRVSLSIIVVCDNLILLYLQLLATDVQQSAQ